MQNNQPTHFIEAWGSKDEYKRFNPKISTNTPPLLMCYLSDRLVTTNVVCDTLQTIAIFKVYPKNN